MSVQAIQQEFPTSVEVISWDNPDDQGVVGLVRSGRGTVTAAERKAARDKMRSMRGAGGAG